MTPAADARTLPRRALIVLGMHRSGTSALTRVLGLCGGALPRNTMDAADSNALGFWEPQPIVDAHDRFLNRAGTRWDAIADYPPALFESDAAAACRRLLADLARREYGDAPLFVLKDPRISRLMPLWRPVLGELGAEPRVVIMERNPLEIAGSMKRRDGWGEHRTLMVWLRYMLAAERDTRGLPRCFVGYDQMMDGWRATVDTITKRLDIAFPKPTPAVEREIDGFIRPDLQHHRHRADALLERDDIAGCVKQAFRCFADATNTGAIDQGVLDEITHALAQANDRLARMTHRASGPSVRATDGKSGFNDTLTALMLAELEQARGSAEHSERILAELRATLSWRLTKPLRVLGRLLGRRGRPMTPY